MNITNHSYDPHEHKYKKELENRASLNTLKLKDAKGMIDDVLESNPQKLHGCSIVTMRDGINKQIVITVILK